MNKQLQSDIGQKLEEEIPMCPIGHGPEEYLKKEGYMYPSWYCLACEEFWDIEDDEK